MAGRGDIEFTYSLIDRIFRLSLGELADFSGAKYDGDFSLSLEEAQRRKHEYVAEQIGIEPGRRVLDLGCGWGPLLDFARSRGAVGVGVTLSRAQEAACRRHGLDVHLHDARSSIVRPSAGSTPSRASARSSTSARPRITAPDARRSSTATSSTSRRCCPPAGRFYLQTMVFGRNMIPLERSPSMRRATRTRVSRALGCQFPARGCRRTRSSRALRGAGFRLVREQRPSRLHRDDHPVERADRGPSVRKTLLKVRLLPRWLTSADFRLAFTSGVSANQVCFERELLDHHRLVFERC